MANRVKVKLDWIESEIFEKEDPAPWLEKVHGILVPGGFGERGSEGKILAARFARDRKVPYFGICFGMQMACIEAARSLAGQGGRWISPEKARWWPKCTANCCSARSKT
jgi:CTP synthase